MKNLLLLSIMTTWSTVVLTQTTNSISNKHIIVNEHTQNNNIQQENTKVPENGVVFTNQRILSDQNTVHTEETIPTENAGIEVMSSRRLIIPPKTEGNTKK